MGDARISTSRLELRPLAETDAAALGAMNADPAVMRFLGGPQTRAASDASIGRSAAAWTDHGFGRWAVTRRDDGAFLGWVTLDMADHPAIAGEVEIGWRLVRTAWGDGVASEAAGAVLAWAFAVAGLSDVVALADAANRPSCRVAEKIGLRRTGIVAENGREMVVFRACAEGWAAVRVD